MKRNLFYFICTALILCTSCEKYVDVGLPKDQVLNQLAFDDDKTATASVVGLYSQMNGLNYYFANILMNFCTAMSADEFFYGANYADFTEFSDNNPSTTNSFVRTLWTQPYSYIYHANACIEGLEKAVNVSQAVKNQLIGEAKFMRAFCHFYLSQLFGDVPLILTTDYKENTALPRTAKAEVMAAVIQDLKEAKELLIAGYPSGAQVADGNGERTRPNRAAASTLLARAYLYNGQWAEAEQQADEVISDTRYKLLPSEQINEVFLKNSEETIWQLEAVNTLSGRNTWEGTLYVPASATNVPLIRLTPDGLKDAFEEGDLRRTNWVGTYTSDDVTHLYPYKYKVRLAVSPATEYSMVLRFAELYLIRAEARLELGKLDDARTDLNSIRFRAGLPELVVSIDATALRSALEKERQVELFAEWGHRWFDLKRWPSLEGKATRADDILGKLRPGWKSTAVLFPIPLRALQTNPNLTQNEGYN